MNFLRPSRERLQHFLPGLDKSVAELGMAEAEQPGSGVLTLFKEAGGPGLMVPEDLGGLGASVADAVHVQRALGARSPSLAVATTMHHFSVSSLAELAARSNGLEWAMLEATARNRWLMSSAFAEGRTGQHILSPTMRARRVDDGLVVSGSKKPCSLTWSMDLLSASVSVTDPDTGTDRMAVILVPADTEGIDRRPFWQSWVLAGAESDEVVLDEVHVPEALVFYPELGEGMDPVHAKGFATFELLVSASYLGMASALVERVLATGKGSADDRALLAIELEAAAAAVEHAAIALAQPGDVEGHLARALYARYGAERTIERVAAAAAAVAGGMAFIGSSDVAYLLAASRALAFHPPSRRDASEPLARYLAGETLVI